MNDDADFYINPSPENRRPRFWMGGVSSTFSVMFSHPMDILKVGVQTSHQPVHKIARGIYEAGGFRGFYQGATASMVRQFGSTGGRIALYELCRQHFCFDTFLSKAFFAGATGIFGSFVGFPADVVNVRMQSDATLPLNKRRYKNVFVGIYEIFKHEGCCQLYAGVSMVVLRGMMVSICSIAVYDQLKQHMKKEYKFADAGPLHFACSLTSAIIGTTATQPLDIIKTRMMATKPAKYKNPWDAFIKMKNNGLPFFYRGYLLNFLRICPHTVITFMVMEQLRLRWGYETVGITNKKK